MLAEAAGDVADRVTFLSLEITGKCQLACTHCYSESGLHGTHGTMTRANWFNVIDQAREMGCIQVQLIGGEPTLHPDFRALVIFALERGLEVEVYTNLVRVSDELWTLFERPGIRLACSYYSANAAQHNAITRRSSHGRTLANIREAVLRRIPLRVGVVAITEQQDVAGAAAELRALGVEKVNVDVLRQIGRGVRDQQPSMAQLCGFCVDGKLAVSNEGRVWPCLLARWIDFGSLHEAPLPELFERSLPLRRQMAEAFSTTFAGSKK